MEFKRFERFNPAGDYKYMLNNCQKDITLYKDEADDYSLWVLQETVRVTPTIFGLINRQDGAIIYVIPGIKTVSINRVGDNEIEICVAELDGDTEVLHIYKRVDKKFGYK